jgi:hypothetical protein
MNNLLYFNNYLLFRHIDKLSYPRTPHKNWVNLYVSLFRGATPEDWNSRSGAVLNEDPWPRGTTVFDYPREITSSLNFSDTFDTIACELEAKLIQENKKAYLFWSGGIDSTAILTAILKNFKDLSRVVVVITDRTVYEAGYFYHKHVKGQVTECLYSELNIDSEFIQNNLILDGEGGDQTFGSSLISSLIYSKADVLNLPFNSQKDFFLTLWQTAEKPAGYANWIMSNVEAQAAKCPWELTSTYEVLWWWNFDGKWHDVMLRSLPTYGSKLNDQDFKYMCKHTMYRFFAHPLSQQWCIATRAHRAYNSFKELKLPGKEYIYNFDKNPHYFYNKRKLVSSPAAFNYAMNPCIAVDNSFNRYNFSDRVVRQEIKKHLF